MSVEVDSRVRDSEEEGLLSERRGEHCSLLSGCAGRLLN
jgi:hypothetical protein